MTDNPTTQTNPHASAKPIALGYLTQFTPKLIIALRQGYSRADFGRDAMAGLTVAILAIPLSMAIAIGSGVDPGKGLITSIVAGFLISAFGGSQFQVGGPAAAFIVIVAAIIAKHGYDGLLTATFLAGLMLIAAGLLRMGTYIKYVPGPVILGFTSAIGVIIAVGQIKDFFGLVGETPGEVLHKLQALWAIKATVTPAALTVGLASVAMILGARKVAPRWPGLLLAVSLASGATWALGLGVETVGTRFGGIPSSLPAPSMPDLGWTKIIEVLPSAFTIAFLVGVELLLSAVAADAIAGTRLRPNTEVLAQGIANVASPLFGGMPATGVIARTGTNIQAGARTPVSGVLHALFVLAAVMLFAPLASYLALPCLAAVLLTVAWRLIDAHEFTSFLRRAPRDDIVVLLATFLLTVFVDLNVAIAVGVILASVLFMHRMAETSGVGLDNGNTVAIEKGDGLPPSLAGEALPGGVRLLDFSGPLFYGQSARMVEVLDAFTPWPKVLILRMRDVPLIDATAIGTLEQIAADCQKHDCRIIVAALQPQPRLALHRYGFLRDNKVIITSNSYMAVEKAKGLLAKS